MPFKKLVEGYKSFHRTYFKSGNNLYQELTQNGQAPETLVIACSDSRADPAIVMNSKPGEMFVVRNVAAIVPPYRADRSHHGTSAAIEFAVRTLKVKHIIVMGHSLCGGIQALAQKETTREQYEFLTPWVEIGNPALKAVEEELGAAEMPVKCRALEQAVILVSLNNLMTFPWIAEPVKNGGIELHGWYFDMQNGRLLNYDFEKKNFEDLPR